jgi:hypothetical protein
MSRIKVVVLTALTVCAVSALAANTASAGWLINGKPLSEQGGSAEVAKLATLHAPALLNAPGQGVLISCKGPLHIINGRIFEPDLGFAERLIFLDCNTTAPTPTRCQLIEGTSKLITITTKPLLALVTLLNGSTLATRLTFTPETGKIFSEIPFEEATSCVFEGSVPVSGSVTIGAPKGRDSLAEQVGEPLGSLENNSLEIGGPNKAFLQGGTALLALANGSKWSFD